MREKRKKKRKLNSPQSVPQMYNRLKPIVHKIISKVPKLLSTQNYLANKHGKHILFLGVYSVLHRVFIAEVATLQRERETERER